MTLFINHASWSSIFSLSCFKEVPSKKPSVGVRYLKNGGMPPILTVDFLLAPSQTRPVLFDFFSFEALSFFLSLFSLAFRHFDASTLASKLFILRWSIFTGICCSWACFVTIVAVKDCCAWRNLLTSYHSTGTSPYLDQRSNPTGSEPWLLSIYCCSYGQVCGTVNPSGRDSAFCRIINKLSYLNINQANNCLTCLPYLSPILKYDAYRLSLNIFLACFWMIYFTSQNHLNHQYQHIS